MVFVYCFACVFADSAESEVNNYDQDNPARRHKRPLRSSMQLKGTGTSRHVLPEICVICQKDRYITDDEAHTQKRNRTVLDYW